MTSHVICRDGHYVVLFRSRGSRGRVGGYPWVGHRVEPRVRNRDGVGGPQESVSVPTWRPV